MEEDDDKLRSKIRNGCEEVHAPEAFKEKLLSRLMEKSVELKAKTPRKLWTRPYVWVPIAAGALALVIFFAVQGFSGRSPTINVTPPPSSGETSAVLPPTTPSEPSTTAGEPSAPPTSPAIGTPSTQPPPSTEAPSSTEPPTSTEPPSSTEPPPSPTTPPVIARTGTLRILVKDAPPQHDVEYLLVDLSNVHVCKKDITDDSCWTLVTSGPVRFDLIQLKTMDVAAMLGEAELGIGFYGQVRMGVSVVETKIDGNVTTVGVDLPSGTLKLVANFEIKEGQVTELTIDFDVEKSLVFQGNGNINFKPVVKMTVEYE
jgi:hypothetical protein